MVNTRISAALLALFLPAFAQGQLIHVKTVPVATGDQFLITPSANLGMGALSIARSDALRDPFVNPAKGARLEQNHLFSAPSFYSISSINGEARTLPAGALLVGRDWFGTLSVTAQQLERGGRYVAVLPLDPIPRITILPALALREDDRFDNNTFAHVGIGRRVGVRTALGASVSIADLAALDGVELLYSLSRKVEQNGGVQDYRVGVIHERESGRVLEALLLHHRFRMSHHVSYVYQGYDPATRQMQLHPRREENLDQTNIYGVHLGLQQPVGTRGWRLGTVLTLNRVSQPEIPNYDVMYIAQEAGHAWAANIGFGAAGDVGRTSFGIDLIYEPIRSDTWVEADAPTSAHSGNIIPNGGRTVDNDFAFNNLLARLGVARETNRSGLQLGLQLRSISYDLAQINHVEGSYNSQHEGWMEWTPSWGGSLKFAELQLRYHGRFTTGTGRPRVPWPGPSFNGSPQVASPSFVPRSGGPLASAGRVVTHQMSVILPIGPRR